MHLSPEMIPPASYKERVFCRQGQRARAEEEAAASLGSCISSGLGGTRLALALRSI